MDWSDDEDIAWQPPKAWTAADGPRFSASDGDRDDASFQISQRDLEGGESLRALVDQRLVSAAKGAPDLRLVDMDPTETLQVDGRPAILLRLLLARGERLVVETAVWVEPVSDDDRTALVVTATAPVGVALETQSRFAELLSSIRFDS